MAIEMPWNWLRQQSPSRGLRQRGVEKVSKIRIPPQIENGRMALSRRSECGIMISRLAG
jgi:hypothetical protein